MQGIIIWKYAACNLEREQPGTAQYGGTNYTEGVHSFDEPRLRVAAIRFLNPAPLMWDFDHPPQAAELASRYTVDWMLPAECADRLAGGSADIGLVPIASIGV